MAAKKRTGLGRGISSLIPTSDAKERPVDVFFGGYPDAAAAPKEPSEQNSDEPVQQAAKQEQSAAGSPGSGRSRSASRRSGTASKKGDEVPAKSAAKRPARRSTAKSSSTKADGTESAGKEPAPAPEPVVSEEPAVSTQAEAVESRESESGELVPIPGATLRMLEPDVIVPNAWQPRRDFDEDELAELVHSVREFGVLQPIVVRPIPEEHPLRGDADYELIMGERRLRASKAAGLETIPAIVKETPDDDMLRDALLENLHRSQLNPLEEASAYQQLLEDFGITQEQLAQRIGRSRPQISNTLRLLKLPVDVQRRVAAGVLSAGHARAILSAGEPAAMTQLAEKIVNEDLSVRAAEAAAAKTGAPRTRPASKEQPGGLVGYLDEVGEQLGDHLNTRVRVTLRRTKGQIVIDFASVADLNRILGELDVPLPGEQQE